MQRHPAEHLRERAPDVAVRPHGPGPVATQRLEEPGPVGRPRDRHGASHAPDGVGVAPGRHSEPAPRRGLLHQTGHQLVAGPVLRAVPDLEAVELADQVPDDVLRSSRLEKAQDRTEGCEQSGAPRVGGDVAHVPPESLQIPVLRLGQVVDQHAHDRARAPLERPHLLRDEEIGRVGMAVQEVQAAVDRVEVGEGHEVHAARARRPVQRVRVGQPPAQPRHAQVAPLRVARVHVEIGPAQGRPAAGHSGQIRPAWSERLQRNALQRTYRVACRMSSRVVCSRMEATFLWTFRNTRRTWQRWRRPRSLR